MFNSRDHDGNVLFRLDSHLFILLGEIEEVEGCVVPEARIGNKIDKTKLMRKGKRKKKRVDWDKEVELSLMHFNRRLFYVLKNYFALGRDILEVFGNYEGV